jgi:hypothetical protein
VSLKAITGVVRNELRRTAHVPGEAGRPAPRSAWEPGRPDRTRSRCLSFLPE